MVAGEGPRLWTGRRKDVVVARIVGECAAEERVGHARRVQEVVAAGHDPQLLPGHQVEEGGGELGRGEVAVENPADRPLDQQVAWRNITGENEVENSRTAILSAR